jgi:hypothetical protein
MWPVGRPPAWPRAQPPSAGPQTPRTNRWTPAHALCARRRRSVRWPSYSKLTSGVRALICGRQIRQRFTRNTALTQPGGPTRRAKAEVRTPSTYAVRRAPPLCSRGRSSSTRVRRTRRRRLGDALARERNMKSVEKPPHVPSLSPRRFFSGGRQVQALCLRPCRGRCAPCPAARARSRAPHPRQPPERSLWPRAPPGSTPSMCWPRRARWARSGSLRTWERRRCPRCRSSPPTSLSRSRTSRTPRYARASRSASPPPCRWNGY